MKFIAAVKTNPTVRLDISGFNSIHVAITYGTPKIKTYFIPFQIVVCKLYFELIISNLQVYLNIKLIIREINPAIK